MDANNLRLLTKYADISDHLFFFFPPKSLVIPLSQEKFCF